MQHQTTPSDPTLPVQYVWHPAIEALFWCLDWLLFCIAMGLLWAFFTTTALDVNIVLARAILVLVAIVLLIPIVFLVDFAGGVAQMVWDNYDQAASRVINWAVLGVFFLIAVPYLVFSVWIVDLAWPHVSNGVIGLHLDAQIRTVTRSSAVGASTWAGLSLLCVGLAWLAFQKWRRNPFYPYRNAIATLRLRKFISGMLLMAFLRLLVPRRDFFLCAPVVSWILLLIAPAILFHVLIPIPVFSWMIPILFVAIVSPVMLASVAPPQWLFLGASGFESFRTFHGLRSHWGRHGITLLDRGGSGGVQFYGVWRSHIGQNWAPYDPTIARNWSIRTRPQVWQTAMRLLAAFVPVVVVDLRQSSDIVEFEVSWLAKRGFLSKTYFLVSRVSDRYPVDQVDGVNLVTEETLIASEWNDAGVAFRA